MHVGIGSYCSTAFINTMNSLDFTYIIVFGPGTTARFRWLGLVWRSWGFCPPILLGCASTSGRLLASTSFSTASSAKGHLARCTGVKLSSVTRGSPWRSKLSKLGQFPRKRFLHFYLTLVQGKSFYIVKFLCYIGGRDNVTWHALNIVLLV